MPKYSQLYIFMYLDFIYRPYRLFLDQFLTIELYELMHTPSLQHSIMCLS